VPRGIVASNAAAAQDDLVGVQLFLEFVTKIGKPVMDAGNAGGLAVGAVVE
jgi:hypothetical protein